MAKAQLRLAKLDQLRQAARSGVEVRVKKECAELGTKVELRVRQAETNRMRILKAYRQRRASLRERTSRSLIRRIARESKYKERVCAAISQKRAAAEKKRLGLLKADVEKAHARLLQVRKVAKSVSQQREIERRRLRESLEDKLQRVYLFLILLLFGIYILITSELILNNVMIMYRQRDNELNT